MEPSNFESEKQILNPDEIAEQEKKAKNNLIANMKRNAEQKQYRIMPNPIQLQNPNQMETSPKQYDQASQEQRQLEIPIMPANLRPSPQNQVQEVGNVIVAKALAEQLGTSPEIKMLGRIDERKLANLEDTTQLIALSHFSYRYVFDGIRYWGHTAEWVLVGTQGIHSLGANRMLKALASTSGVQSIEKADKPNVIARNLWNKGWKEKAETEGKIVE